MRTSPARVGVAPRLRPSEKEARLSIEACSEREIERRSPPCPSSAGRNKKTVFRSVSLSRSQSDLLDYAIVELRILDVHVHCSRRSSAGGAASGRGRRRVPRPARRQAGRRRAARRFSYVRQSYIDTNKQTSLSRPSLSWSMLLRGARVFQTPEALQVYAIGPRRCRFTQSEL